MADDAFCTLICLVEGGSLLLKIEPKGSVDIFGLKELIWEKGKNSVLKNVDAVVLTLWKVRVTMASDSTTDSPAG
jgi:hypothetical protein